jgi:Na+-translocating ferredoxin:NAD+ oxidoreductase RnfG subunit
MERRVRLHVLGALATLALVSTPSLGSATVFMTQPQALAEAFPGARIERRAFFLTDAQAKAIQQRARAKLTSKVVTEYQAWRGDTLQGTAWFDTRVVRTMPAVLMIVVAPDSTVERVDVLAFHEPPDYRPTARWLGLFPRRRLDDRLKSGASIRYLSGATFTTRAVVDATRLALALYEALVAPTLRKR